MLWIDSHSRWRSDVTWPRSKVLQLVGPGKSLNHPIESRFHMLFHQKSHGKSSGWWFGTYFFPLCWKFHNPNWRTPSFFRGVGWNHQPEKNSWWFPWCLKSQAARWMLSTTRPGLAINVLKSWGKTEFPCFFLQKINVFPNNSNMFNQSLSA